MDSNDQSDQRIVESVLENLDLAVLTRPGESKHGSFRLIGRAPDWFASCFGSEEAMLERSAFLDDFVRGAASDCWKAAGGMERSGIWEESAAEGTSKFFEARALNRGGEEVLVLALADERHARERELIQHAHDEALDQRRLAREREKKEILLDCIVHDLSSPLSTVLMNIQHVERQLDRDDLRQALLRAETQAERQRALILSIANAFASDLSSFEPVLLARSEGVDIGSIACVMLDAFQLTAEKQRVRIDLDIDSAIVECLQVVGEGEHLTRVFDNLLTNALRRSSADDTITVKIRARDGHVRTTVEDEGAAITGEMRKQIFVPFARRDGGTGFAAADEENEDTNAEDRYGLGLYFCKMTVELWGGSIGVDAPTGGGNRFWFELPEHHAELEQKG